MASKGFAAICAAASAILLAGCVSVHNEGGLTPPTALCSHFRATVGCPRASVPSGAVAPRVGRTDGSVHVKEWVWSGISADVMDMALRRAAENGGLSRIYYADYEQTSYLGFVTVFNLIAYGE